MESDPIGLRGGVNTFAYSLGNPVVNFDPLGLGCISLAGTVMHCVYPGGGPDFYVPAPLGVTSDIGRNSFINMFLYHQYDVQVPLGAADEQCVMRKLMENPTPGNPNPASEAGTRNNAPALIFRNNWVTSYLTSDRMSHRRLVVNVADSGSAFPPGYVARTVSDGVVHTYGEGLAWEQALPIPGLNAVANWTVWKLQMKKFVKECSCEQ